MEIALVTGPSSGIGRATALDIASRGYHVVAAGRSEERISPVISEIESSGGSAEYLYLDLDSLESCERAAREFAATGRILDVIVNNAGVRGATGLTIDGFEKHFGVNHLGHFMLTHHLRPSFRPGSRIVAVSSEVHRRVDGIDFDRVRKGGSIFTSLRSYGVSKLANILFARRLAELRPEWHTYSLHPGMADTNIFPAWAKPLFPNRIPPETAAKTSVHCATSDEVADETGLYYSRMAVRQPSPAARDDHLAQELWERSARWCGVASHH